MQYLKINHIDEQTNILDSAIPQYEADSSGRILVDFNNTDKLLAIPLYVETFNTEDFNNVVDKEFSEFVKIQSTVNANLNALNDELKYYKELNLQNKQLQKELKLKIADLEGKIILTQEIENLQNIDTNTTQ